MDSSLPTATRVHARLSKTRHTCRACVFMVLGVAASLVGCEKQPPAPRPVQTAPKELRSTGLVLNLTNPRQGETSPVLVVDTLAFRTILTADSTGGLSIDDERRIVRGEAAFKNSDLQNHRTLDQKLQVKRFTPGDGTTIVQVNISNGTPLGISKIEPPVDRKGAPILVDHLGQRYSPVGYVCKDAINTRIRFYLDQPLEAIIDLPDGGPTVSRSDQEFVLVFRVTSNMKLAKFIVGDTEVCRFEPKLEVK